MKYRKFNKYEKKEVRAEMLANALHGEGLYLFRNNTDATITLPRPTKSGLRVVGARKEFQGDNYYMQLVRQGLLRLVKEIQSPEAERAALALQEAEEEASQVTTTSEVKPLNEQKLILDQPDQITEQGKVEHVVAKPQPQQKLNENNKSKEKPQPVLLNENPVEGGFVIVG